MQLLCTYRNGYNAKCFLYSHQFCATAVCPVFLGNANLKLKYVLFAPHTEKLTETPETNIKIKTHVSTNKTPKNCMNDTASTKI